MEKLPCLLTSAKDASPAKQAESKICRGSEDSEPPEEAFSGIALIGSVTKYLPVMGYRLVKSHMFEGELKFRIDRIMPEFQAHPLHENEEVEFDVQADEDGKAVAVAVKPVLGRKPYDVLGQRHQGYVRRFVERLGLWRPLEPLARSASHRSLGLPQCC